MDKIEVLVKAKELLTDPEKWHKGYYAADKHGRSVEAGSDQACKWCMFGAILKVSPPDSELADEAADNLREICKSSVPVFNDAKKTTHQDVMNVFDKAIVDALNQENK